MGPAAARPEAILGLFMVGANSTGCCLAGPNLIYSPWVWQPGRTQSLYLKKIQKY
jgi:hypothetical protein